MAYATTSDIQGRMTAEMTIEQIAICQNLLEDSAVVIDAYNKDADADAKKVVSCNMVVRAMGNISVDVPIGATQGSISALGYSQSWTMSGGSTGELYLSKLDKKILGVGNRIGAHSPIEAL